MKFIAVVLSVISERLLGLGPMVRCYKWFACYIQLLTKGIGNIFIWRSWGGVIITLLPLLLVTGLVQWMLRGSFWGLPSLIFGAAIMLYCFGPNDLHLQFAKYFDAHHRGDAEAAKAKITEFLGHEPPKEDAKLVRAVSERVLTHINQSMFAIIFWYMVFGPFGAVLYRFTVLLKESANVANSTIADFAVPCERLQNILDWLPVRLIALTYALVGDFIGGFAYWWQHAWSGTTRNNAILIESGLSAMAYEVGGGSDEHENTEILALTDRALITWLILIGLGTLAKWLL